MEKKYTTQKTKIFKGERSECYSLMYIVLTWILKQEKLVLNSDASIKHVLCRNLSDTLTSLTASISISVFVWEGCQLFFFQSREQTYNLSNLPALIKHLIKTGSCNFTCLLVQESSSQDRLKKIEKPVLYAAV